MNLSNKHKSLLITLLLSGTIVLALFSFHIKKQSELISESYYLLEPETLEEIEAKKRAEAEAEAEDKQTSETNKGFNKAQEYKRFSKAYQPIAPPENYVRKTSESATKSTSSESGTTNATSEINDDILSSYNSVNDVLNRQKQSNSEQSVNNKSSMHYSLVNRTHQFLPTPIYLCEENGKVTINITVNASGTVTNTSVNSSSSSNNDCLIDQALSYAKDAKFSSDASKASQIGTITFYFKGKN